MHAAISVYQNYTGQKACFDLRAPTSADLGDVGWDVQACTEMVMPMCANGTDMFEVADWNVTAFAGACGRRWFNMSTRPDWAVTEYGGDRLHTATNIIFSNGLLDPWSGGGVMSMRRHHRSVKLIHIRSGAHHYDLRAEHPMDTGGRSSFT